MIGPITDFLARPFAALGIHPNAITLLGALLILIPAYYASEARWLAAGLLLAIVSCFDFLDGAVARAQNKVTPFGGWLDSLLDRLSDGVILLAIGLGLDSRNGWLVVGAALIAQYLTSYARARSYQDATPPPETWNQLFERPERIIYLCVALILQGILDRAQIDAPNVLFWLLLIYAILAAATVLQRGTRVYKLLAKSNK